MQLNTAVTSKGQVTIPSYIREALNIKAGDRLRFDIDHQKKIIIGHPAAKDTIDELAGSLKSYAKKPFSRRAEKKAARDYVVSQYAKKLKHLNAPKNLS